MKAAPVDLATGDLLDERFKIPTPQAGDAGGDGRGRPRGSSTTSVHRGRVGVTFPGVIRRGVIALSAANLDPSWVGTDVDALFTEASGVRRSTSSTTPTPPGWPRCATAPAGIAPASCSC